MTIQLKKVKLRDGMFATVEYDKAHDSATDQIVQVCNNPVHEDFKDRLQDLAVHAALICELIDVSKVKGGIEQFNHPILPHIKVKGVSVNHDDSSGVTISFERKLSTGRVLNLNTPFTKFNDDQVKYRFDSELQAAVGFLEEEVIEYLDGKFGEGAQMEMEFQGDDEDQDHI